jgi:PAS domain S-box-containing protein
MKLFKAVIIGSICFINCIPAAWADASFPIGLTLSSSTQGSRMIPDTINKRVFRLQLPTLLDAEQNSLNIISNSTNQQTILPMEIVPLDILPLTNDTMLIAGINDKAECALMIAGNNGRIGSVYTIPEKNQSIPGMPEFFYYDKKNGSAFFIYKKKLWQFRRDGGDSYSIVKISDNDVLAYTSRTDDFLCLFKNTSSIQLAIYSGSGILQSEFPFASMGLSYRLLALEKNILILAEASAVHTMAVLFRPGNGSQNTVYLPAPAQLCTAYSNANQQIILACIAQNEQGGYLLHQQKISDGIIQKTDIPIENIEPVSINYFKNLVWLRFRSGLALYDIEKGDIQAADILPGMRVLGTEPLESISSTIDEANVLLTTANGAITITLNNQPWWWLQRLLSASLWIFAVFMPATALFLFIRRYLRQRRFLEAGLELSGLGIILAIDGQGRLRRLNAAARQLLGISADVPLRRPARFYCTRSGAEELLLFIEKAHGSRQSQQQKVNIQHPDGNITELLWSATPLYGFAGRYSGCLLAGIDITEELERKRLTNWAQLSHDMQTNLSIILLNAQQLQYTDNSTDAERKRKIMAQSSLLLQRVRDIVTVGRSDTLDLSLNDAAVLCRNVINEFDENLFPNAHLIASGKPIMFECDPIKLSRALRNAVENGIRALQSNEGTVELSCSSNAHSVMFHITDTGTGMDEYTRLNMMKPYFTTKQSEGGYGIGTMVMQRVVELHKGRIEIISQKGKGSTITFIIPRNK